MRDLTTEGGGVENAESEAWEKESKLTERYLSITIIHERWGNRIGTFCKYGGRRGCKSSSVQLYFYGGSTGSTARVCQQQEPRAT